MHFGNFILYYNFLTNSVKLIKVYIIRKGISQGRYNGDVDFSPKITIFKKIAKKPVFFFFFGTFFRKRLEKNQNSKSCFQNIKFT